MKKSIKAFFDRLFNRTKYIPEKASEPNSEVIEDAPKQYTREEYRDNYKNEAMIAKAFDVLSNKFNKYNYIYEDNIVITPSEEKQLNDLKNNKQIIIDIAIRMLQRIKVPITRSGN